MVIGSAALPVISGALPRKYTFGVPTRFAGLQLFRDASNERLLILAKLAGSTITGLVLRQLKERSEISFTPSGSVTAFKAVLVKARLPINSTVFGIVT